MTPEEAIRIVAMHVAAGLCEGVWDSWDPYPEIGERDFEAVCARVQSAPFPDKATYDAAYQILTNRAALAAGRDVEAGE